ncbi:MAG: penicillin-binding protein [Bacteroidota bacterium]
MINYRALILTLFLLLVFVGLSIRLFNIQITNNEYYKLIAERQQNKPQIVNAERGLIKDINGEVLSYTKDNISFFVDTRMMNKQKVDTISSLFARIFNKNKTYYRLMIENGVKNICLEKKVSMDKALQLKSVFIEGLYYEEDFTRVYPYGSLASHLLGYVDKLDMKGVEGIEKVYTEQLTGTDGYYVFERDVLGRILSVDENLSKAPEPGNNIILTLNKTYQKIVEEELVSGLKKFGGKSASGIIMNPNTGEIYAMANTPDFDPANYEMFPQEIKRNKILTDTYEPGSTMKSISMSILFDKKLIREDEIVYTDNGTYKIKNAKITDTHPHEKLTVREVLEQSSNIGMAKLSARIDDEDFYKYLRDFGFSNPTSIDLIGEAEGYLKKPDKYSLLTKPFLSFGYEISVTPIQMITAYSALVNGGIIYQPFILKYVTDSSGKILEENKPKRIRSVIDKSTSELMKRLMVGVVEQGTGTAAQLDDVLVGGKTGTSQKLVDNSYSRSKHNSSFIGFFPADNPKLICLILVDSPEIGKYGGLVAAPIFHEVAKRIVETDLTLIPEKKKIKRDKNLVDQLIADIKSAPVSTSRSYLNIAPSTGNGSSKRFNNINRSIMPDLINYSLRDAIAQLNELGLKYKITGNGKVVMQSINPGEEISRNDTCYIKCEPNKKLTSVRIK